MIHCILLFPFVISLCTVQVSEEKVSRVEAYVLFYRRKHPLQPLQRILKQIEAVTVHNAAQTATAGKGVRYVSRHWIKKMEVLGRPEPIDNRDLCCPHGMPKPLPKVKRRTDASRVNWSRL